MGLAKFLVEAILGEAAEIDKVVVVYSGRFQPFHKGHYATYDHLVKKFGRDNVYIGTSDVTDNKKSPFGFKEKKAIMQKMFGISSNKIVQIKNPYAPQEILNDFDSDTTGFITVVGEKDSSRLSGKYFTPYKGKVEAGYLDKGYVYASPAQPNAISGTDVRYWLSAGNEEERKKNFTKAYPKFDEQVFKLITLKLKKLKECINEEIKINVKIGDTILMGRFKNKKVVVKTIGTDDWGMPTINGKKVATFRIPKKEELKEAASNAGFSGTAEPDTSFVADRQKRILNKEKPENWYKQGGYTQLDKPKADNMRGVGKTKDTETQFRKSYYKINNVEKSTLNPADDPHKVEDWKEVKPKKAIKKPKRFWELPENQKDTIISKEDIKEIVEDFDNLLDEMGLGGGAGVGLSLPGGYINGAPDSKDVKKNSKKLNNKGMSGYEEMDEDNIPGGLAKGKTLIDLAKRWDPKGYYDPKQFAYGPPDLRGGTTSDGLGNPTLSGGFVQALGEAGRGGSAPVAPAPTGGFTPYSGTLNTYRYYDREGKEISKQQAEQGGSGAVVSNPRSAAEAQARVDAAAAQANADAAANVGFVQAPGEAGRGGGGGRSSGGDGGSSNSNPGDPGRGGGGAHLAKGGPVSMQHLLGPDPAGPDDGYAALKDGEFVINDKAVKKYGIELMNLINSGKISKGKLRGLLEM